MPLRHFVPRGHSAGLPAFVPYPFFTGILPIVAPQAPPQRAVEVIFEKFFSST